MVGLGKVERVIVDFLRAHKLTLGRDLRHLPTVVNCAARRQLLMPTTPPRETSCTVGLTARAQLFERLLADQRRVLTLCYEVDVWPQVRRQLLVARFLNFANVRITWPRHVSEKNLEERGRSAPTTPPDTKLLGHACTTQLRGS